MRVQYGELRRPEAGCMGGQGLLQAVVPKMYTFDKLKNACSNSLFFL